MRLAALLPLLALAGPAWAQDPAAPAPAAPAAPAGPVTYKLDGAANALYVIVRYDRSALAAGFAHDHVVAATGWTGSVTWDAANPAACKISVEVPVAGLDVDPAGYRARAGIDPKGVSANDEATITSNFQDDGQLDLGKYPKITFASSSCAEKSPGVYTVKGTMTLRGAARPTQVDMKISADGKTFSAAGRFDALHTDWGFQPFSGAFGTVRNDNKLTFVLDVKGGA